MEVRRTAINILTILISGIYMASPFLCLRTSRKWGALAAILVLWLPIEFSLFRMIGVTQTNAIVIGMAAGILAFRSRPDLLNVTAAFDLRRVSFRDAAVHFAWFSAIGLPLGFAIGFIHPAARRPSVEGIALLLAGILFFNALPEEILFRGIIQDSLESVTKSRFASLIATALIFGMAHLNNGPPLPNYRYFVMATLAGIAYGLAWGRNKNVLTSTITHTLVNAVWRLFLR
jgi:membrane protease YdiL (CAAX protease family)